MQSFNYESADGLASPKLREGAAIGKGLLKVLSALLIVEMLVTEKVFIKLQTSNLKLF